VGGDITDPAAVDLALAQTQPQYVIHLAGLTGAVCESDAARAKAVNTDATEHLALKAAAAGVRRLVFASSAAVYGDAAHTALSESDPLNGSSTYARTKIDAESALERVAAQTGLEVVALRIFNVYGEGFPGSLVSRIAAASADSPVVLKGEAGFVRDYVHGDDVATAIRAALAMPMDSAFMAINVASGVPVSNADLASLVPERSRPFVAVEPGGQSFSVADVSLSDTHLGTYARDLRKSF
jgi:UDP-glucose 4-epimerase